MSRLNFVIFWVAFLTILYVSTYVFMVFFVNYMLRDEGLKPDIYAEPSTIQVQAVPTGASQNGQVYVEQSAVNTAHMQAVDSLKVVNE